MERVERLRTYCSPGLAFRFFRRAQTSFSADSSYHWTKNVPRNAACRCISEQASENSERRNPVRHILNCTAAGLVALLAVYGGLSQLRATPPEAKPVQEN